MDTGVHNHLLTLELFLLRWIVYEMESIVFLPSDSFRLDFACQYIGVTHMIGHICGKDHSNHALSHQVSFIAIEIFNETIIFHSEYFHRFWSMPVLLNGNIVETECSICHKIDMVTIVETIVGKIMACRRSDACN